MSHFRTSIQATALAASLVIALAPALAAAKAGGGTSAGSRGSRTTQSAPATPTAPSAAPVERSATPPAQAPRPAQQATPAPAAPAPQPAGFFQRNPFMAGMLGGLVGAGLVGMLFGGGLFGGAGMGFAGILGLLLQIALIGGLAWLGLRIYRSMRGPQPQMASANGAPTDFRVADIPPAQTQARMADIPVAGGTGLQITEQDFEAFQQALGDIQSAWTKGDLEALRRHATPEMIGYFSRELSLLASKGLANHVEAVTLEQGDLAESWSEDGIDYATVAMRWSALDYTTRIDNSAAVEGSRTERGMSTEVWTFMRGTGGKWLLSAIQQPGLQ